MQKYSILDFRSVLDAFLTKELNRKSLKDNYSTQIVLFLMYIPALLGIIAFIFDFGTVFNIVCQSMANFPILGTILGVLLGLIVASIIFLFISLGTLRSAKNLRIFFADFVADAKIHKWAIFSYTPKFKNLFYACFIGSLAFLGLKGTLYLSTHANYLVTSIIKKPSAQEVQIGLEDIREKEAEVSQRKLALLKEKKTTLSKRLNSKIAANSTVTIAQQAIDNAVADSLKAVSKQWQTITTKQNAIKKRNGSPTLLAGYQKDITYRKTHILPPLEQKHHRRIEQKRQAYRKSIQEELTWYDQELALLGSKEKSILNTSDSLENWLTGLYQEDISTQIANIDFLAFFAAGGNRYINLFVFAAFFVLGFFAIPDFGEYKPNSLNNKDTQAHTKNTKTEYVWYEGKKTKASQVRNWIKTYERRIGENTQTLDKLQEFVTDQSISENEIITTQKKIKTIGARIKRTKEQLKKYQTALNNLCED